MIRDRFLFTLGFVAFLLAINSPVPDDIASIVIRLSMLLFGPMFIFASINDKHGTAVYRYEVRYTTDIGSGTSYISMQRRIAGENDLRVLEEILRQQRGNERAEITDYKLVQGPIL